MSKQSQEKFSFSRSTWQQFKKNKASLVSLYILLGIVLIAILSPLLANKHPLYAKYNGESFFPAFTSLFSDNVKEVVTDPATGNKVEIDFEYVDWRTLELESVVWALIPYSPDQTDRYATDYLDPSDKHFYPSPEGRKESPWILRHHLGTDDIGRDVASGLIHGTKISLMVGLVSMGIATIIGISLGAVAGFYGDNKIKVTRIQQWLSIIGGFIGFFIGFVVLGENIGNSFSVGLFQGFLSLLLSILILILSIFIFYRLGGKIKLGSFFAKQIPFKVDSLVSRIIEVLNSLPNLLLIITVSAVLNERSLVIVMVIIGATSWTGIARFTRAEFLKLKNLDFIQAAYVLGYSDRRIMFKHILPNGIAPVFVSVAFGIASAILVESALSFLGIGVPDDVVTWGSLLSLGRSEFEAWWLVIYPGLAIFITITVYNLIGEGLRDALDPKHKK